MMRLFAYSSKHLEGEVLLGFESESGFLVSLDMTKAVMSNDQHIAFLIRFPRSLDELKELVAKDKTNRFMTEVFHNITFEMAWDKYNHKALSHKKKSLAKWEKMSEGERAKAYTFIERYDNLLIKSNGQAKKHFESFLTAELWNN